jgi:signal transduction histidine kinase
MLLIDLLIAGGIALLLAPMSVNSLAGIQQPRIWTIAEMVSLVMLHGSVALRRKAPVLGFLLSCLAMLLVVAAPFGRIPGQTVSGFTRYPMLFTPSNIVFLLVVYAVCAGCRRELGLLALGGSVFGVALAAVRFGQLVPHGYPPLQYRLYLTLALLLGVVAASGLGLYQREMFQGEQGRRAQATRAAILGERSQIARELHDIVSHSLAVVVRQAEGGAMIVTRDPQRAAEVFATISEVGREALQDMRGMLAILRSTGLESDAAPTTISGTSSDLSDLPGLMERMTASGLPVVLTERGQRYQIPRSSELAVHQVVREALTNTLKHAGTGAKAQVILEWQPRTLTVEVRDELPDGWKTGTTRLPVPGSGTGLYGLQERIAALGGQLSAGPEGSGFVVRAVLPARGEEWTR